MKLIEVRDDAPVSEQLDVSRQNQTALLNEISRVNFVVESQAEMIEANRASVQKVAGFLE